MHQAANVIYLFERAQGPGKVVSVWVESTEQMIAGALIAQRLNKTEGSCIRRFCDFMPKEIANKL